MKLMVIGFPKSGTTSITRALRLSGLKAAHWKNEQKKYVGSLIYHAVLNREDPLENLREYDAITQPDVCVPAHKVSLWPQLDFAVLSMIRRAHPTCWFLLNYRRPEAIADSMMRWEGMVDRLTVSDIPGLPATVGGQRRHLIRWIENHFAACRLFFANDPYFAEIDIEAPDVPERLGAMLGIKIHGWGDFKPPPPKDDKEAEQLKVGS